MCDSTDDPIDSQQSVSWIGIATRNAVGASLVSVQPLEAGSHMVPLAVTRSWAAGRSLERDGSDPEQGTALWDTLVRAEQGFQSGPGH